MRGRCCLQYLSNSLKRFRKIVNRFKSRVKRFNKKAAIEMAAVNQIFEIRILYLKL
jgi:hypothetical protein